MFFSRQSKYKILFTSLFCGGFLFLLWHSYYVYVDNTKTEDLPLIRASKGIIFKPKDPGGIIIPDKDKDIYNSMSGRASKPETARIEREEPEQVITKVEALALIDKQLRAQGIKPQTSATPLAESTESATTAPAQPTIKVAATTQTQAAPVTQPAAPVTSITSATPPATPAPSPQIYYVRVAKITSPEVFEQAVVELKKTYPLLDQLQAKLATKNVDGTDKYYVHLGPVAASSKAQDICRQLETLGKACRVVENGK